MVQSLGTGQPKQGTRFHPSSGRVCTCLKAPTPEYHNYGSPRSPSLAPHQEKAQRGEASIPPLESLYAPVKAQHSQKNVLYICKTVCYDLIYI